MGFKQEVAVSKERLLANLGRCFICQVNVDTGNPDQPGTAVTWRTSLYVEVVLVVSCRLQRLGSWYRTFMLDQTKKTLDIPQEFMKLDFPPSSLWDYLV